MNHQQNILEKITLLRKHGIIDSGMFTAMRGQIPKDILSVVGFLKNIGYDLHIEDMKIKINEYKKTEDYKRVFYHNTGKKYGN